MARGRGTLMAKFDVASAYRNMAIHPDDRPLLGMQWRGKYFVDLDLPFRLRPAPFIFISYGVDFLRHHLDDFFTLGPSSSLLCHSYLLTCVRLSKRLGLPLHPNKVQGPTTCVTILGIELDTDRLQARLPTEKRD